jgi:hypothetical protein
VSSVPIPGEDEADFEKLRQDLFDEISPEGALEETVVTNIARLI